jgi:hypothetical protein
VQVFEQLWDDYADRSLACFLEPIREVAIYDE